MSVSACIYQSIYSSEHKNDIDFFTPFLSLEGIRHLPILSIYLEMCIHLLPAPYWSVSVSRFDDAIAILCHIGNVLAANKMFFFSHFVIILCKL